MKFYRLQRASVWRDRSSLRVLRLLAVGIIIGAAAMLFFGEGGEGAPSLVAKIASLRSEDAGEKSPSFPVLENASERDNRADAKKQFARDWPPPPSGSVNGAESRGTLSTLTSLNPGEGLHDDIRADAAPYNESAEAALADVARQADAALIQTLARLGLGTDSLELVNSETRFTADSLVYPFLRLKVRPVTDKGTHSRAKIRRNPATSSAFEEVLADSLDVWAPAARLHKEGVNWYLILVGDAVTHSIRWEESDPAVLPSGKAPGDPSVQPSASLPTDSVAQEPAGEERIFPSSLPKAPVVLESKPERHYLTIVIDDVGESLSAARELLDLPYPVTLAIWPRSSHAAHIATLAHERGRQVFLHQPMEPVPVSGKRMGPGGLYVGMTDAELANCLRVNLRLVPYVAGVNNHMGSRFTSDTASVRQFCTVLRRLRPDVMVLDSLTLGASVLYDEARTQEFAAFRRTLFLDDTRGKEAILKELDHGLELARHNAQTIVIGHPRPDTLAALAAWRGFRERDVCIVPLARRPDNINSGLPAFQTESP